MEAALKHYCTYLVRERGMVPTTVRSYAAMARMFLQMHSRDGELQLDGITAERIVDAVLDSCPTTTAGRSKQVGN